MAEDINTFNGTKSEQYQFVLQTIQAVTFDNNELISNLSNITSVLKQQFNWWWIGFYWVKNEQLVLYPFQGTLACTSIAKGKGVCGSCWQKRQSIIVPNVHAFEGHIACSSKSKSEIVVPIFYQKEVIAVIDADSEFENYFDQTDQHYLELLAKYIEKQLELWK